MANFPTLYVAVSLLIAVVSFLLGKAVADVIRSKHSDGVIFIGVNDDGDDRIVFQLNMDYDELANYDTVVFNVVRERKAL